MATRIWRRWRGIRRVNASRSTRTLWMRLPGYAARRQGWQDNDNGWRPMGMQLQEGTERKRGRRRRSRRRPTDKCASCLTFADAFSRTWTGTDSHLASLLPCSCLVIASPKVEVVRPVVRLTLSCSLHPVLRSMCLCPKMRDGYTKSAIFFWASNIAKERASTDTGHSDPTSF